MKVALSVDSFSPQLTGIGRYTLELVRGLAQYPDDVELGFYRHGRAVKQPEKYASAATFPRFYWPMQKWLQRQCYLPLVSSRLCHGTNYFLPKEANSGIITVHDLSVFKYPETHPAARIKEFELQLPASIQKASHIITDSEAVRQEVIDYFALPATAVTAIYLGVDPAYLPAAATAQWPFLVKSALRPMSYSLCVSTLEPRKRIGQLLNSYQMLPVEVRQQCPLVLAGAGGWSNQQLKQQIAVAQAEGWLIPLGYVSETELIELYQGAKLFIYPSAYEGFGLPVVEAMACAVPVLISDASCLTEVAGGAAAIVDTTDIEQFSQMLANLLSNPSWLQKLAAAGLHRSRQFTWQQCVQDTLKIYQQVGSSGR